MDNRLRTSGKTASQNITINDIAEELGLSKTTISRAISGKGRIGSETREKVLSYIKEHGYRPNLIAKSLAVSKTFNIAVTLPADAEVNEIPFFQTCLHGITERVNAKDYDVVLSVTTGQNITGLKRLIRNQKVDGVSLTRLHSDDKAVVFLQEVGIPFVVIGSSNDTSIVQVDSDHFSGCRDVTAFVLSSGFRRIVLLAGNPAYQVNKDRYAGYQAAFGSAGMEPDSCEVFWNMMGATHIDQAMSALMKKKPECLVCMDDVICGRVLSWLQRNRYEIPRDVSVVSFHDSAFMEQQNPPVTALHINVPGLGSAAGDILLELIAGNDVPRKNRVGFEVIIRDSSRAQ
jgi:DNA-binding LacI/PurR family transcriptional regulator